MSKYNGGSAFPVQESEVMNNGERAQYAEPGMTLRDYFAAKAMPLFLKAELDHEAWAKDDDTWVDLCAQLAYDTADAMLKAREQ